MRKTERREVEDYSGWPLRQRLELLAFDARLVGVPKRSWTRCGKRPASKGGSRQQSSPAVGPALWNDQDPSDLVTVDLPDEDRCVRLASRHPGRRLLPHDDVATRHTGVHGGMDPGSGSKQPPETLS